MKAYSWKMQRIILAFVVVFTSMGIASWQETVQAAGAAPYYEGFEDGTADHLESASGNWVIVDEDTKAYASSVTEALSIAEIDQASWVNYAMESKVKVTAWGESPSQSVGIITNYQDLNNYYAFVYDAIGELQIVQKSEGAVTTLASKPYSIAQNKWTFFRAESNESTLTLYVDGVKQLEVFDETFSGGQGGLLAHYSEAKFDDVRLMGLELVPGREIESAIDDFGTFTTVVQGAGNSLTPGTDVIRGGAASFKHVTSGDPKRAELDDNSWHAYNAKTSNYWYGFSYFIPDDGTYTDSLRQFAGQWRFSNIVGAGATIPNCAMSGYGGSGHHLMIETGHWVYNVQHQDPTKETCSGLISKDFELKPFKKGVWTDIVVHSQFRETDGFIKVWIAEDGGGYEQVMDYHGPTWFDQYQEGSALSGREMAAPNFTVGSYWSNSPTLKTLYSDQIRAYQVDSLLDDHATGFTKVRPEFVPKTLSNTYGEYLPSDDAYVSSLTPDTTYNGEASPNQLIARNDAGQTSEVYLKYDLSSIDLSNPATKVKLRVFSEALATPVSMNVYGVAADNWSETTLNWNNKPAKVALVKKLELGTSVAPGASFETDVTSYIKQEKTADGKATLALTVDLGSPRVLLKSKERTWAPAQLPYLIVDSSPIPVFLSAAMVPGSFDKAAFSFNKAVFDHTGGNLKEQILLARNGFDFEPLAEADSVSITDKTVNIDLDIPLIGKKNRLWLLGGALKGAEGNVVNLDIISPFLIGDVDPGTPTELNSSTYEAPTTNFKLTFKENIEWTSADSAAQRAAVQISLDNGATYSPLAEEDTVTIEKKDLKIHWNTIQPGAQVKIKINAGALRNLNALVTNAEIVTQVMSISTAVAPVLNEIVSDGDDVIVRFTTDPANTDYTIKYGFQPGNYIYTVNGVTDTDYRVQLPAAQTPYYMVVSSSNETGSSANSNEMTAISDSNLLYSNGLDTEQSLIEMQRVNGTYSFDNNRLKANGSGFERMWLIPGKSWTDYSSTLDISFESVTQASKSQIYVLGRVTDANNYYLTGYEADPVAGTTSLNISRKKNGTNVNLATKEITLEPGETYELKTEYDDNEIKLYLDGELQLEVIDEDPLAAGSPGFLSVYMYAYYDNLVLTSLDTDVDPISTEVLLTGESSASVGADYTVHYGLSGAQDVTAQDIRIQYDPELFEYTSSTAIAEGLVIQDEQSDPEAGTLRIIAAQLGAENALNGDAAELIAIKFQPKGLGTGTIEVMQASLSNSSGEILSVDPSSFSVTVGVDKTELASIIATATAIHDAAVEGLENGQYPAGTKEQLETAIAAAEVVYDNASANSTDIVNATADLNAAIEIFQSFVLTSTTGDFNGTAGYDIGDVGMISYLYGTVVGDAGWNSSMDINGDGEIGLYELAFVVKRLLNS
jgi:hypothetical protein